MYCTVRGGTRLEKKGRAALNEAQWKEKSTWTSCWRSRSVFTTSFDPFPRFWSSRKASPQTNENYRADRLLQELCFEFVTSKLRWKWTAVSSLANLLQLVCSVSQPSSLFISNPNFPRFLAHLLPGYLILTSWSAHFPVSLLATSP